MGKLLVVDDDEALRRLMRLELSDTYKVINSGGPEQGLAIALESRPDAILPDLRMPKYSGYELLQTFTSLSHTQRIPVIVVSGEAGSQTKEHCKQLGAARYFEKPIDFDALRVCLRQVARHRQDPPRSEVRVRLRFPLKLRSISDNGAQIEELATTENVSMSGFLCVCTGAFAVDSNLAVFLTNPDEKYVGKVRVVHSDSQGPKLRRYGCVFIEKSSPWCCNSGLRGHFDARNQPRSRAARQKLFRRRRARLPSTNSRPGRRRRARRRQTSLSHPGPSRFPLHHRLHRGRSSGRSPT